MIRLIYLTPPQSKNLRVCIQMYTTSPPPPYSYEPLGIQLKKIFYLEEGQGYTFYK